MRRDQRVRDLIRRAGEACKEIAEEAAAEATGDPITLGEFVHAQMEGKPNEIFVIAKFTNTRNPPLQLRCHVCAETLSQASAASWPVRLQRATDGTWFFAVLVTCVDPVCGHRLMEKLQSEGP